jgi:hypothetical protein
MSQIRQAIEKFFFFPASPRPLGAMRIGLAATLIAEAIMLRGIIFELFARDGIIQGELADYLTTPYVPRVSSILPLLSPLGLSESTVLYFVCTLYFVSLLFLFVGLFTRTAAVITWFLHWTLMNTGFSTTYGVDLYAHVFLFYSMFVPVGDAYSLDVVLGRRSGLPSQAARLGLRVLQLQLCISYLCSGIDKAQGPQWWNGELIWRALCMPVYYQYDMFWMANYPFLSLIGGWTTLVLEIGYCVFIWPKRTRKFWVAGIASLHLGISIFLGLGLFGVTMFWLTVAVFGFSAEPSPIQEPIRRRRREGFESGALVGS